jgi:dolichol-phosphate mannosyltransferase
MKSVPAIIVPVYNESENLKLLIPRIFTNVKNARVVVVDDSSTDNTASVIKTLKRKYKSITHLVRPAKMGRGTAVLHGFSYALKKIDSSIFVEMDADLSHDPDELPKLLKLSNENTIVIASRYLKGSKIIDISFFSKIRSRSANMLNSLLFGLPIHDNTNGYRIYPRKAVKLLTKYSYKSSGFVSISESTYYLSKKGFKLIERPSKFVNRKIGGSKADFHEIFISIRDLLKIKFSKI